MSEESTTINGNNDLSGKVTIKYKGEDKVLNLSDPEDLRVMNDLLNKGYAADKVWSENADMRRQIENWNAMIASAKEDPAEMDKLVGVLEGYLGKPLTKQQKEDLNTMTDTDGKTATQIKELKKALEDMQLSILGEKIETELSTLEKQFKSTAVPFDRDKVIEYARKNNLVNYEQAYFLLNKDKLLENAKKDVRDNESKRKTAIDNNFAETDTGGGSLETRTSAPLNYNGAVAQALQSLKSSGKSLYTED